MKFTKNQLSFLALVAAAIIWGATTPIMKLALETVPVFSLAFIRFATAAALLFPFVIKKLTVQRKDLALLVLAALAGVTYNIYFFFVGLKVTTALNAGIIIATTPIFSFLFAHLWLREKLKLNLIFASLLGMAGIVALLGKDLAQTALTLSPSGDMLILLATISFVIYEIVSKKLFVKYDPLVITFYSFLIGGTTFLPAATIEFVSDPSWLFLLPVSGWFGIFYGILFSSFAAYTLWQWGLSQVDVSKVGFFLYISPLTSTIASILILSERISSEFIIGAIFIILGIIVSQGHLRFHKK